MERNTHPRRHRRDAHDRPRADGGIAMGSDAAESVAMDAPERPPADGGIAEGENEMRPSQRVRRPHTPKGRRSGARRR